MLGGQQPTRLISRGEKPSCSRRGPAVRTTPDAAGTAPRRIGDPGRQEIRTSSDEESSAAGGGDRGPRRGQGPQAEPPGAGRRGGPRAGSRRRGGWSCGGSSQEWRRGVPRRGRRTPWRPGWPGRSAAPGAWPACSKGTGRDIGTRVPRIVQAAGVEGTGGPRVRLARADPRRRTRPPRKTADVFSYSRCCSTKAATRAAPSAEPGSLVNKHERPESAAQTAASVRRTGSPRVSRTTWS